MAIVKMLLNRVEYPRKDIPDQVVIPADTSVTFLDASWAGGQTMGNGFTAQKYVVEVKAELGNLYFCQVPKNTDGEIHLKGQSPDRASGYCYVGVRKSECTPVVQNGGGYCVGYIPSFAVLSEMRWSYARSLTF